MGTVLVVGGWLSFLNSNFGGVYVFLLGILVVVVGW